MAVVEECHISRLQSLIKVERAMGHGRDETTRFVRLEVPFSWKQTLTNIVLKDASASVILTIIFIHNKI
jgi:hypothetical protein